jgi:hypothetical protein
MCEHPGVTGAHLRNLLDVKGGSKMAQTRRQDGDYPFHYLCKNSQVSHQMLVGCIEAFLSYVPEASKWRGKW